MELEHSSRERERERERERARERGIYIYNSVYIHIDIKVCRSLRRFRVAGFGVGASCLLLCTCLS